MNSIKLAVLATSILASATAAQAATVYTNRAAFLAASTGVTTNDFEENASGAFTNYGSTYTGVGYAITDSNIFTVDPDFDPFYQWNSGDVLDAEGATLTVTADGGVTALGFDYGNPALAYGSGIVTINGVNYALGVQPDFNFFGIIDAGGVGPIVVNWNGGLGIMDNLSVGDAGVVPEPAAWALMIAGFGLVGAAARRRTARVTFA